VSEYISILAAQGNNQMEIELRRLRFE